MRVYHNNFNEIVYHNLVPTALSQYNRLLRQIWSAFLSLEVRLLDAGAESDGTT